MNKMPTVEQLSALLADQRDDEAHHILWVDELGEVHVSPLPHDLSPVGFDQAHPELRLRYETFGAGNEYTGPKALAAKEYISTTLKQLIAAWSELGRTPGQHYVDH
jgi:hypothetical protein